MPKGGFGLKNKAHGLDGPVKISNTPARQHLEKSNTASGQPHMVPVVKGDGADRVAKTIGAVRENRYSPAFDRMSENKARKLHGE